MYRDLNSYLDALRAAGELAEITARVDPVLEIAEIVDRVSKRPGGGKALLFTDTGTDFPLLINALGSDRRICMALGVSALDELAERIYNLFGTAAAPKETLADKARMLPLLARAARWLPRRKRGRGACQQVVMETPDLSKIPILQCWPHDGGRFVTLPLVHTQDPDTKARNVGMYRMQVFSENTTGMHWHRHKTGARHYEAYKKRGGRMPVTVCLGGDPAYTYCATAPLPDGVDEYLLAGFIRNKPVELVKCLTNELEVPADCDFVIEGYVDPAEEKVTEGPFGDHTGFYSLEDRYPLFHITCITHRKNAVYPATLVGIPPQEDFYIGKATEKLFLAPIRLVVQPEIRELHLPLEGTAHNIALLNIDKTYPGQAFKVAGAMWGAGQMMFNKFCVITSSESSVSDPQTLRRAIGNVEIPRDVLFARGPLDVLDHAAPATGFGGKCCLDATPKTLEGFLQEDTPVTLPEKWVLSEKILRLDDRLAENWRTLLIHIEKKCANLPEQVEKLLKTNEIQGIKFILAFDPNAPLDNVSTLLWLAAANCDAVRDVAIVNEKTLLFDARIKAGGVNGFARRWPEPTVIDTATIALVDRRWEEYNLGTPNPSPSLIFSTLASGNSAEADEKEGKWHGL